MFGLNRQSLQGHLAMARISNSPTVITNVLAGTALAGGLYSSNFPTILMLSLSLLAFYTAGMYLNDLCDYEVDRQERAERPLITGVVSIRDAWIVTLTLFALAIFLLLMIDRNLLWSGLVLIFFIVLYDVWHKGNLLSPVIMGLNRLMVYVIAYLAFQPELSSTILIPGGLLAIYILGVTLIAKSENTGKITQYWPILVLLLPVLMVGYNPDVSTLLSISLFAFWIIYCSYIIYRHRAIKMGVGFLLAGICLLDGIVLGSTSGIIGAGIAVIGFLTTLYLQRFIKGT